MEILYLALFAIGIYAVMTLCRRWADSFVMIAFAIGCVVNANIFTAYSAPIDCGALIFGIDSILITMFFHLVVVKYIHYPLKDFKLFVASSLAAIVISAFIEFFANVFNSGYSVQLLKNLLNYFVCCVAIALGIAFAIPVVKIFQKKRVSKMISLPIGILIANVVDTVVYYLLAALVLGSKFDNIWPVIGGSYIGKLFAICIGVVCYCITTYWGHKDVPNKYFDKAKQNIFDVECAKEKDVDEWVNLAKRYRHYYPGLETEKAMEKYKKTVTKFIGDNRALLVRIEEEIAGIILYSKKLNMICFLLVDERYRNQGIAKALVEKAIEDLDRSKPIVVHTYVKGDYRAEAAWDFYSSLGFIPTDEVVEENVPQQVFELNIKE